MIEIKLNEAQARDTLVFLIRAHKSASEVPTWTNIFESISNQINEQVKKSKEKGGE